MPAGVDGDQFEIGLAAKPHEEIVGAHALVAATGRHVDAEQVADIGGALLQRRAADRDVVEGERTARPCRKRASCAW